MFLRNVFFLDRKVRRMQSPDATTKSFADCSYYFLVAKLLCFMEMHLHFHYNYCCYAMYLVFQLVSRGFYISHAIMNRKCVIPLAAFVAFFPFHTPGYQIIRGLISPNLTVLPRIL